MDTSQQMTLAVPVVEVAAPAEYAPALADLCRALSGQPAAQALRAGLEALPALIRAVRGGQSSAEPSAWGARLLVNPYGGGGILTLQENTPDGQQLIFTLDPRGAILDGGWMRPRPDDLPEARLFHILPGAGGDVMEVYTEEGPHEYPLGVQVGGLSWAEPVEPQPVPADAAPPQPAEAAPLLETFLHTLLERPTDRPPAAVPEVVPPPTVQLPPPVASPAALPEPATTTRLNWVLIAMSGPYAGQGFPLKSRVTLGQAEDNDIRLNVAGIAPYHAMIAYQGERYVLTDLGSATGTLLNDQLIARPTFLKVGDVVSLGVARWQVAVQAKR